VVVNGANRDFADLTAEASRYDFSLRPLFTRKARLASAADSVQRLFTIPEDNVGTGVSFVRLTLSDRAGRIVSRNFYWLPRKLSTFDWSLGQAKAHPYYTAVKSYEDLTMLNRLPKVRLEVSASARHLPEGEEVVVTVRNPSGTLAFQVHLSLVGAGTGEELLPVLWEDNFLELMPGESRTVVARYDSVADAGPLKLEAGGWNIEPESAAVAETGAAPGQAVRR
jgi:exo-1,4-beta-D-glucosaminidase